MPGMQERVPEATEITMGLSELAALLLVVEDAEEALRHLARIAVAVIPDGPSCGISVAREGKFTTAVYTGAIPATVHEAQYERGDGPVLEAMRTGEPVVVQDFAAEHRWGTVPAVALEAGAHGAYAHPLRIGGEVAGALCLYAHERNLFPDAVQQVAVQFVEPASVLLGGALRRMSQAELIDQLRSGMASRAVIDQAIGIMMAQRRCRPEEALTALRKISNDRNIKLRQVAADLVESVALRPPVLAGDRMRSGEHPPEPPVDRRAPAAARPVTGPRPPGA